MVNTYALKPLDEGETRAERVVRSRNERKWSQ